MLIYIKNDVFIFYKFRNFWNFTGSIYRETLHIHTYIMYIFEGITELQICQHHQRTFESIVQRFCVEISFALVWDLPAMWDDHRTSWWRQLIVDSGRSCWKVSLYEKKIIQFTYPQNEIAKCKKVPPKLLRFRHYSEENIT